jgi:hypothetical protein
MKCYNVSANHYNRYNGSDGYAGTRAAGKQVRIQPIFSKKKLTGSSQTRTRLPAYTRTRVHGYEL